MQVIHNFKETDSTMKMKPEYGVWTILIPDNIEAVWAAVIRRPHCSIHCQAVSLWMHSSSAYTGLTLPSIQVADCLGAETQWSPNVFFSLNWNWAKPIYQFTSHNLICKV